MEKISWSPKVRPAMIRQLYENDARGTAVMQPTETYLHDYPQARTTEERMVCIDQLIHAFHIGLQTGRFNRSFANNLIEGSHDQVVEFLDGLSAGPGRVDKEQWRAGIKQMYANRRGQKE